MNFVETLTNKHPTFHVIEEIVTTNREMNTAVQFCAKDGTILYDVPNIRKLKKINQNSNATNDAVVDDIVTKIVEYYTKFFQYVVPKEKLTFGFKSMKSAPPQQKPVKSEAEVKADANRNRTLRYEEEVEELHK